MSRSTSDAGRRLSANGWGRRCQVERISSCGYQQASRTGSWSAASRPSFATSAQRPTMPRRSFRSCTRIQIWRSPGTSPTLSSPRRTAQLRASETSLGSGFLRSEILPGSEGVARTGHTLIGVIGAPRRSKLVVVAQVAVAAITAPRTVAAEPVRLAQVVEVVATDCLEEAAIVEEVARLRGSDVVDRQLAIVITEHRNEVEISLTR